MCKLGAEHKVWRKRWCRVDGSRLLYFTKPALSAKDARGFIDLRSADLVSVYGACCTSGGEPERREHVMSIETRSPRRVWLFSTETAEELFAWVDGLGQVIAELKSAPGCLSPRLSLTPRLTTEEAAVVAAAAMKSIVARRTTDASGLLPELEVIVRAHGVEDGELALTEIRLSSHSESKLAFRLVAPNPSSLRIEPVEGTIVPGATHLVTVRLPSSAPAKVDVQVSLFIWDGQLEDLCSATADVRCAVIAVSFDVPKSPATPSPRPFLRRPSGWL